MITRSEAIKQLRLLKADIINGLSFVSKTKDKHKALKSLDMAIASMETDEAYVLEYENPDFCKDCISRQVVDDYIARLLSGYLYEEERERLEKFSAWINELPSVLPKADVPETNVGKIELTTKNDLGVDWDELKRKILMEVDGGTDDAWLAYGEVCDRISNSIDEFVADMREVKA